MDTRSDKSADSRGWSRVPDGFDTSETWPFECLRCLHVWEEDYVVRHLCDVYGHGGDIWLSSGVPVPPPWSGTCCPGCGRYDVTWFPSGYSSRHPELVPALEPEPGPVPVPAPVPPPGRTPAASRTYLPGRLLVGLGVPMALFVGYELYANIIAMARPQP